MPQASASPAAAQRRLDPWERPDARTYVRIENVSKSFGDFRAVDGVSIDIYRGEFFALLGASGCGKTTLLRMLAGFEAPSGGRIRIDDQDITHLPPYARPVNMMFQNYALFPHMTVADNVAYGLKQDGVARAEIRRRVGQILDLVQLAPWAKRKPHQLSGGQRQRVALARALVKRPKVLLLDEPLAALDKKLREQTQFELMNIQEEVGVTFIFVTHDQEEAMTLSTRMAVMDQGRVMQMGTPTEIYEFPANRFTADFIGSVNMMDGTVARLDAGHAQVAVAGFDRPFTVALNREGQAATVHQGQPVSLAVRPEKIAIQRDHGQADTHPNRLRGIVRDFAYLGDASVLRVDIGDGRLIEVTAPNTRRALRREIDWDDPVVLWWEPEAAVVLTA